MGTYIMFMLYSYLPELREYNYEIIIILRPTIDGLCI